MSYTEKERLSLDILKLMIDEPLQWTLSGSNAKHPKLPSDKHLVFLSEKEPVTFGDTALELSPLLWEGWFYVQRHQLYNKTPAITFDKWCEYRQIEMRILFKNKVITFFKNLFTKQKSNV